MKICVRDAFASHSYRKDYDFVFDNLDLDKFTAGAAADFVRVHAVIEASGSNVFCRLAISADFKAVCSRCASQFVLPFSVETSKQIKKTDTGEFEDVIYTDASGCFDITREVESQICFEFPAKPLCRKDCKGLCPVCGCDLNKGSCTCDTRIPDSRLAVLKNLIDNN